jgi:hypothetical protein
MGDGAAAAPQLVLSAPGSEDEVSAGNARANRVRNAMRVPPPPPPTETAAAVFHVEGVTVKRELVRTQTVRLRSVQDIKGDSEWAASKRNLTAAGGGGADGGPPASPWSFTAVVKKEVVLEQKAARSVTVKRW